MRFWKRKDKTPVGTIQDVLNSLEPVSVAADLGTPSKGNICLGGWKDWYLFYAVRRWGLWHGCYRYWLHYLRPDNWWFWAKQWYKEWRLIDRRKRLGWPRNVWAINRDGDLGLVECPKCNEFQTVTFCREDKSFECYVCDCHFDVYLEDGVVRLKDHREGNVKTPTKAVTDETGILRLGIDRDAPWWWERKEVYRDYNPDNGMDGHGHYPYAILPPRPHQPTISEAEEIKNVK
jgi:hypothetical protein